MLKLNDPPEQSAPTALLLTRRSAAALLGCSIATIIRMELGGQLCPIKLTGGDSSMVYFRRSDIEALAQPEAD